ncbi:hypothetical protein Q5Y75_23995 [Ruegeria sp. 2205SS24-7]|uniref:hypothetical protein n=1 Tax=Ruegeria discodermiae TaxID=3064389 RepID=UPI0027405F0C|nr:hypothetical protein [Ruegeria sp. 2205SS24-7]MDP5220257.1 hypothetical protein [Ruegeria sp. 2205SS24-7]
MPNSFSCLVWFVTLVLMFLYVQHKRVVAFSLLANAFDAWQREFPKDPPPEDFAGRAPFWLAPVRWVPNWAGRTQNFNEDRLLLSLGWNRSSEYFAWLLAMLFGGFWLLLSGYVTLVGMELMGDHERTQKLLRFTQLQRDFTQIGFVFAFLLCVILSIAWLARYSGGSKTHDRLRRSLIGSVPAALAGSVFGAPLLERWMSDQPLSSEFNPTDSEATIAAQSGRFFQYKGQRGTQLIYFPKILVDGYPDCRMVLDDEHLIPVDDQSKLDFSQIRLHDFTTVIEIAALERIDEDNGAAVRLLEDALNHMFSNPSKLPVSYRLIDLLHRIQLAQSSDEGIARLRSIIAAGVTKLEDRSDPLSRRIARDHQKLNDRLHALGKSGSSPKKTWSYFRSVYIGDSLKPTTLTLTLEDQTVNLEGN